MKMPYPSCWNEKTGRNWYVENKLIREKPTDTRKILLYILFCLCYYHFVLFMVLRAVRFTVCGASPDFPKQEMLFHKRAVHHEGRECLWHGLHWGVCSVYDSFNICVLYLHLKFVTLWRSKHQKCLSNHPKSIFQDQYKIHSETSRR